MPKPTPRDRDDEDRDDDRPRKPRRREDARDEDRPPRARRRDEEPDDYDDVPAERPRKAKARKGGAGVAGVIPYRNGAALAAYYCGVFGLIPLAAPILSPIAFILGIIGLVKARKDPKARGTGHAIAGIVMGLVSIPAWIVLWFTVLKPMMDPAY